MLCVLLGMRMILFLRAWQNKETQLSRTYE